MEKVVFKILQGSVVTNHVRWTSYIFSGCQFPIVYMCQKLWKLASSRQSYCKKISGLLFLAHPVFYCKVSSVMMSHNEAAAAADVLMLLCCLIVDACEDLIRFTVTLRSACSEIIHNGPKFQTSNLSHHLLVITSSDYRPLVHILSLCTDTMGNKLPLP